MITVLKIYFSFFYDHGILLKGFTMHVVVDVPNRVLICVGPTSMTHFQGHVLSAEDGLPRVARVHRPLSL